LRLQELLERPVAFAGETVGHVAAEAVAALGDGDIVVLENLRFNSGETSKDDGVRQALARQLAELADAMVSDGFGVVHRKQASVYDVAALLPHYAGTLVAAEVKVLEQLSRAGERLPTDDRHAGFRAGSRR
jgi:phosphoglycerate kinase